MRNAIIIFSLIMVVVIVGLIVAKQRRGRLTSESPASVVRTTLRQLSPKENGRTETDVVYRFDANGSSHEVTRTILGNRVDAYPPGTAGQVRYNPANPSEADVITAP